MSEQTPASGPITDGPADPEHDSTAAYGLDRAYVAALTRRVVSTSGETAAVASPIGGTPLAHVPQSSTADVAEAFARGNVAVLVGDWTRGDAAIGRFLEKHGRSGVPLYLYYAPGKPAQILPQVLTTGRLVGLAP